ncbi:discoidin domain-containing protein [Pseudobacteroides cellulosolvens]|uniref:Coagulation factor 5/8 type domain protein n=1 Tax=Pseudobacteroides cellulosolvens ATCC 35603 = DSM 2933 TaxID=398512 RepID=A0A0L6JLB6_9FIRM|nr:discoidin domain-containing protein [Pseudobacteroides cellulosolvens]KNY26540.1 coagulation factor 5/8 type domain protein [Pseudobacteroides cellulosolvens ATCC 35603 = DSM 2933]
MRSNVLGIEFQRRLSIVMAIVLSFSVFFIENPRVYAADSIKIEFYNGGTTDTTNIVYTRFKITNTGTTTINASSIKFRYYFTDDGVSPITTTTEYASNAGTAITNNVTYVINTISATNANSYLEFGFNSSVGTIAPGTAVTVNSRFNHSSYSKNFTQSNDYSFCSTNSNYATWDKVTAYINGVLASGVEPISVTPTKTSTPTLSPTPSPTQTSTPTRTSTPGVSSAPTSTAAPVSGGSITKIEAENGVLSGALVQNGSAGYSGTGFLSGFYNDGVGVTFNVSVSAAGTYNLSLRYANGMGSQQQLSLYVNGSHFKDCVFPYTSGWDSWTEKADTITLNAGSNTIMLKRDSGDGALYLDYITISQSGQSGQTSQLQNLLSNGDFSMGTNLWSQYAHSGAVATGTVQNGEYKMAITNTGTSSWHVGVGQTNFSLVSGKTYKVSFDARSTINRTIIASIHNSSSYVNYLYQAASLTNAMTNYSYYFVMNTSDTSSRIAFDMGSSSTIPNHDIYIDNVIIQEVADSVVIATPQPTPTSAIINLIKNGSFIDNTANWNYQGSCYGQVINGEYKLSIYYLGSKSSDNQFYQKPFSLSAGKTYKLSLDARAASSTKIRVFICNGTSYTDYISVNQDISTNMANYSYTFTMAQSDSNSMFGMDLGKIDGATTTDVYFDNIILQEISSPSNTPNATSAVTTTPTKTPTPTSTATPVPADQLNLALGKNVFVSSEENGYGNVKQNAVDGNYNTRWASGWSDNQWIYVDLGSTKAFNRVKLMWEVSYGKAYKIQVSNDANSWTDVYTTDSGDGSLDDIFFSSVNARYVRMYGITRAIEYSFSLWEFEVYNVSVTPTPTRTATPTATRTPMPTGSVQTPTPAAERINIAIGKTVSADTNGSISQNASQGNDDNGGTRWCAGDSGLNHWWKVDLGGIYQITGTQVVWEFGGRVYKYKIEISNNDSTWNTVVDKSGNQSTLQVQSDNFNATGRYVRLTVTGLENGALASFWEFKVFTDSAYLPAPPPTPTPDGGIIKNGKFDDGTSQWQFSVNNSAGANAYNVVTQVLSNNVSKTSIANFGTDVWNIKLAQGNFTLEKLKKYRLSFDASSTISRDIKVEIASGSTSVKYLDATTNVNSTSRKYTYEFNMFSNTDSTCKLTFNMGQSITNPVSAAHDVIVDNVSIILMGDAPTPTPGPTPVSGDLNVRFSPLRSAVSDKLDFGEKSDIELTQGGEISIEGTMLGKKEVALVLDNSGAFNSYMTDPLSPFDFGIFANKNLSIQGNSAVITGSTYSQKFSSTGMSLTISQNCTAQDFFVTTPNLNVNKFQNVSKPVDMPYLHPQLINEAILAHQVYSPYSLPSGIDVPMLGQTGINIRYEPWHSRFVITGNGTFKINKSMYFKGNLLISLPRIDNTGNAFLVADGDITLQGNSLSPSGPNDKVYVYSIGGNIEFQTSNSTINGIAYAPGSPERPGASGNIRFIGNANNVKGSIVGQNINLMGGGLTIDSSLSSLRDVEEKYIQNSTYLNMIKYVAKEFIDKLAGTDTKLGIIKYSESANSSNMIYYDLSIASKVQEAKAQIDAMMPEGSGASNMGDGIRRANELLKDPIKSSDLATKYMVVLSGSAPNKWTKTTAPGTTMKTDGGAAHHYGGDGAGDSDGSGLEYAKTVGAVANSLGIETLFIDFSSLNIDTKMEQISVSSGSKEVPSTGKHFYKAKNYTELTSIFDYLYEYTNYEILLNNVLYEEIFPKGIRIIEGPSNMTFSKVVIDGSTRDRATGVLNNVKLKYDGSKYILNGDNFKFKLRFIKPGDVTFKGADSSITYTIEYIDSKGVKRTVPIKGIFNDITVNVGWVVDIT